jgi:hypothetical protein
MEIVSATDGGSELPQEKILTNVKDGPRGGIDDYERDTASKEDMSEEELFKLLLPDGKFPLPGASEKSRFFLAYSNEALVAWVKQRSPGCAAASVASAWNALGGLRRNDPGARTMDDNIEILKEVQSERVRSSKARVERLLGGRSPDPVIEAVKAHLAEEEKIIGGESKTDCAGKKTLRKAIKAVIFKSFRLEFDDGDTYVYTDPAFDLIRSDILEQKKQEEEMFGEDAFPSSQSATLPSEGKTSGDESTEGKTASSSTAESKMAQESENSNTNNSDDNEAPVERFEIKIKPAKRKPKSSFINWEKEFMDLFGRMGGLRKLCRKRPNTAAFGNWGINSQVNWLAAESEGLMDIRSTMMMGKRVRGSSVRIPLSSMDREEDIYMQWLQLRAVFTREDTILLSHHTNHYALIYAIREWVTKDGEHVRQILTARKGQRPTAWIDWSELRNTYVKWAGYKLMQIQRYGARPSKQTLFELKQRQAERKREKEAEAMEDLAALAEMKLAEVENSD